MSCLTARDLGGLEAHALDESEEKVFAEHLAGCSACTERHASLKGLLAAIGAPEPAAELAPRPETWSAIAARLRDDAPASVSVAIACAYCKGRLARIHAVYCATCLAPHHEECWTEDGACAACRSVVLVRAELRGAPPRRQRREPLVLVAAVAVAAVAGTSVAVYRSERAERFAHQQAELVGRRAFISFTTELENQAINVRSQISSAVARMKDHDPAGATADLKEALRILDELPKLAEDLRGERERGLQYLETKKDELRRLRRDVWLQLGRAWEMRETRDALDEALSCYRKAREQGGPADAESRIAAAHVRARMGRFEEALRDLDGVLEADATSKTALLERGDVWGLLGRPRNAIADFTRVTQLELDAADAYLRRGRAYLELREYAKAKADFEKVLERRDSDWRAFVERGRAKAALGDASGAYEDLTEAVDLQPSYPDAYFERGELSFAQEKLSEAIKDYEVAITRSNHFYKAYLALGRALEWSLDYERAALQYDEVLRAEDREGRALRPRALAAKANLAALRADAGEVLARLEREARVGAADAVSRGILVERAGTEAAEREAEARRLFDEALALEPRLVPALVGRARLALARGAASAAAEDLRTAEAALRDRPWAREKAQRPELASSDPELATVRTLLGQASLLAKDWDGAIAHLDAACAADPASAFALAGLALAWDAKGDAAKARGLLERARVLEAAMFEQRQGQKESESALRSRRPEYYERARWAFARGVAADSYHALAFLERGRLSAAWKAWDLALADASRAIAVDPYLKDAYELRGDVARDRAQALRDYTKALELGAAGPALERAHAHYARALLQASNDSEESLAAARRDVESAIAALPAAVRPWIEDDATPARTIAEAAVYHELHGKVLEAQGELVLANEARAKAREVRRLTRLVAGSERDADGLDPNPSSVHNRGKAERDKRRYTDAIALFDRAIALDAENGDFYYDRGTCYLKIGNFVPAILDFSRALELNPRFADQFYNKVYQVSYVVDLNRVITELNTIVADHPDSSHVVFLRGFFYVARTEFKKYDRSDLDAGIRDFDRTLRLNPKHVSAYVYRGFLHYKAALICQGAEREKEFETAVANYARAEELDPKSGITRFLTAMVWSVRSEDPGLAESERTARRDRAVKELTVAIEEREFKGFERIKNDKGFAAVKDDPRVQKLVQGK